MRPVGGKNGELTATCPNFSPTHTYLVHAHIQWVLRLGVDRELDFGRGQLQCAAFGTPLPQDLRGRSGGVGGRVERMREQ